MDINEVVQTYLSIREERERLKSEYEETDKMLKQDMEKLDQVLLQHANELNVNSFRTDRGTVIRELDERFICSDWDNFRKFEQDNPDFDFRERRIHQKNIKAYLGEHPDDGLPPGVNVLRKFSIVVRRASS